MSERLDKVAEQRPTNPVVIRVIGWVVDPSAAQVGLPGFPAPDLTWDIAGDVIEKRILDSVVSCARGKRGAEGRLLRQIRDYGQYGSKGTIPERAEKIVIGRWVRRGVIVGFVVWFDKVPDCELSPCPSKDPDRIDRRNVFFRA